MVLDQCGVRVYSGGMDLGLNFLSVYVLNNDLVDNVIVGVDGIDHFKSNISNLSEVDKVKALSGILDELMINDEDILLPYKWKVK